MSEHAETEVWIDPVSRKHCYIRLGPEKNLATVNFPADSAEAEAVRSALERLYGPSANRAENQAKGSE